MEVSKRLGFGDKHSYETVEKVIFNFSLAFNSIQKSLPLTGKYRELRGKIIISSLI